MAMEVEAWQPVLVGVGLFGGAVFAVKLLQAADPQRKNAALPGPKVRPLPRRPLRFWEDKLPKDGGQAPWLGAAELETLSAVLDTLLPAFDVSPKQLKRLEEQLRRDLEATLHSSSGDSDAALALASMPSPGDSAELAKFFARAASDVDVAPRAAAALAAQRPWADRAQLRAVLALLGTRVGGLIFGLGLQRFQDASFGQRQRLLQGWAHSVLPQLRQLFQGLKKLGCALFLGLPHPYGEAGQVRNPSWKALQYEPRTDDGAVPRIAAANARRSDALHAATPALDAAAENFDVIVVGSGGGGGTAASVLAARGLRVAVLEKGGHFTEEDFAAWTEAQAYEHAYENAALLANKDASITVLAGACVGGGTTINWCASFRPPPHVLKEWARDFGLGDGLAGLEASLDAVCAKLGVGTRFTHRHEHLSDCAAAQQSQAHVVNAANDFLVEGAHALGMPCRAVPRNVKGCVDCGSCSHGCVYGAKQGTLVLLREAAETGRLALYPRTTVDYVTRNAAGAATGVHALREDDGGGDAVPLRLRARAVIVSAGSVNTPKVLGRSGLRHPVIGRHLTLHPVTCVTGSFDRERNGKPTNTAMDRGVSMGTCVREENIDFDGQGYGVVPETPPVHPFILGLGVPWKTALLFKSALLTYRRSSVFVGICRDHSSAANRIALPPRHSTAQPLTEMHYNLTREDEHLMVEGVKLNVRLMHAAGARVIFPTSQEAKWFVNTGDNDDRFEEYIGYAEKLGMVPNSTLMFSAHQMSSCRMSAHGGGRFAGPVKPNGECREAANLYVMDGSILPTSLGINPMITIMGLSHMLAHQLATKLGAPAKAAGGASGW
uniref:long-chain-alcohol oxidase n=1 Tax=Phaeomonas parva TaxID=124430 RepID=A0A7S1UJN9_9STRA|mmetsp:Transcript_8659/g.25192  ORF Transcript_8659/g.25192 Transcript_8659/m.25192 type:complete len:835 (+) Transcript_8659:37-2541(+)